MKNLIILGFLVLLLVCAQFVQAQTVDEVINKHIAALGSKENLSKIQNVVMQGSLNVQGIDVSLVITIVNKKLNRQEITALGKSGFEMLTDKEGWSYSPLQGMAKAEPIPAEDVKLNQADLDVAGPLVDYIAKGHTAELIGKVPVDGKDCHHIKLTLFSGKIVNFFIDSASFMIARTTDKRKIMGVETEMQTDYGDYKDVEGVKMPHSFTQQIGTVYISSIKVNQTIPESAFKHDI